MDLTGEQAIRLCEVLAKTSRRFRALCRWVRRASPQLSVDSLSIGTRTRTYEENHPKGWPTKTLASSRHWIPHFPVNRPLTAGTRNGNAPSRAAEQDASRQQDAATAESTVVAPLCAEAFRKRIDLSCSRS